MKKILSTLMICALLVGLVPAYAKAENVDGTSGQENIAAWENIYDAAANFENDGSVTLPEGEYPLLSGVATADVGDTYFYEVEYNDLMDLADEIEHDYTVCGELSEQDVDYYKFDVTAKSDVIFVAVSNLDSLGAVLFDANGEAVTIATSTGSENGLYSYVFYATLDVGTYYIGLADLDQATGNVYLFYLSIAPLHTHSHQPTVTEPTCVASGYTTYTCDCGDTYTANHIAATGVHTFASEQDTTCTVCGYSYTNEGEEVITTPMYRLYNPNTGEHFYTGSIEEKDNLVTAGWQYEGVAWNAPVNCGEPVYRVYNPNSGDHHYTMSQEEVDMLVGVGWQYEGICWNSASAEILPLYRLYNPNADCGSHHYTGSIEERENLIAAGWIYEGIGWYGLLQ